MYASGREYVIFDLDGTLTNNEHRQHYLAGPVKDWDGFTRASRYDTPNTDIVKLTHLFSVWYDVRIWSGRDDSVRHETEQWLIEHDVAFTELRMRPHGDFTADDVLKQRWLKEQYTLPFCAIDDRDRVVRMWRSHGITCLQVREGDF